LAEFHLKNRPLAGTKVAPSTLVDDAAAEPGATLQSVSNLGNYFRRQTMSEAATVEPSGRALLSEAYKNAPVGVSAGITVTLLVAGLLLLAGIGSLSQATAGTGMIAAACFIGICARVLQAGAHHKAMMGKMNGAQK
jgi:hypothetical protein